MIKLLKTLIHFWLHRKNRWLLYCPPGTPTGWDLGHDLSMIVARQNPMILDVGANRGQSIDLFSRVLEQPIIHAFEPTEACHKHLTSKAWRAEVHAHHFAIGEKEGSLTFYEYGLSVLNSTLRINPQMTERFGDITPTREAVVPVRTLDSVTQELGITSVDLLKVDTQGQDLRVLRGASRLFKAQSIRAVMVEINHEQIYCEQDRMIDILSFMEDNGFMLVDLYEKFRKGPYIEWSTALFVKSGATDSVGQHGNKR